jgi:hypothetical protein
MWPRRAPAANWQSCPLASEPQRLPTTGYRQPTRFPFAFSAGLPPLRPRVGRISPFDRHGLVWYTTDRQTESRQHAESHLSAR